MLKSDKIQLEIEIGNNKARKSISDLESDMKRYQKQLTTLSNKGREETKEYTITVAKLKTAQQAVTKANTDAKRYQIEVNNLRKKGKTETTQYTTALKKLQASQDKLKHSSIDVTKHQNELTQIVKDGKQHTKEYADTIDKLKHAQKKYDKLTNSIKITDMSMSELTRKQKYLNTVMRNLPETHADYQRYEKDLQKVNTRLAEMRKRTKAVIQQQLTLKEKFGRAADSANRYSTLLMSITASLYALISTIKNAISALSDMSDIMSEVRKTTGLTAIQIRELRTEFRSFETRTATKDLLGIARIAGKLGVDGVKGLSSFTEEANIMAVSLGKALGDNKEETINTIGKIIGAFKLDKVMGWGKAIRHVGATINELGKSSTASEKPIVEYLARMSAFAISAGITIDKIAGIGATLDSLKVRAEMGGTSMNKFFAVLAKPENLERFSKMLGVSIERYKEMVQYDLNDVMIQVLKSAKKGNSGLTDLLEKLDAADVSGVRMSMTISTLVNNVDKLVKQQQIARDEFKKGTSTLKEYNLMNDNFAGRMAKAKRKIVALWMSFLTKLQPTIEATVNTVISFISVIKNNIEIIKFAGKAILIYVVALVSHKTALKLSTLWTNRATVATKLQTLAQKASAITTRTLTALKYLLLAVKILLLGKTKLSTTWTIRATLAQISNTIATKTAIVITEIYTAITHRLAVTKAFLIAKVKLYTLWVKKSAIIEAFNNLAIKTSIALTRIKIAITKAAITVKKLLTGEIKLSVLLTNLAAIAEAKANAIKKASIALSETQITSTKRLALSKELNAFLTNTATIAEKKNIVTTKTAISFSNIYTALTHRLSLAKSFLISKLRLKTMWLNKATFAEIRNAITTKTSLAILKLKTMWQNRAIFAEMRYAITTKTSLAVLKLKTMWLNRATFAEMRNAITAKTSLAVLKLKTMWQNRATFAEMRNVIAATTSLAILKLKIMWQNRATFAEIRYAITAKTSLAILKLKTMWQNRATFAEMRNVITTKISLVVLKLKTFWTKKATVAEIQNGITTKASTVFTKLDTIATSMLAVAKMRLAGNVKGATQAMRLFNHTAKLNPFAFILAAIIAVTTAIILFSKETKALTNEQKFLADIYKKTNANVQQQSTELKILHKQLLQTAPSSKERIRIVRKLNEQYPDLLKNLNAETASYDELNKRFVKYLSNLKNRIRTKVLTEELTQQYRDKNELDKQKSDDEIDDEEYAAEIERIKKNKEFLHEALEENYNTSTFGQEAARLMKQRIKTVDSISELEKKISYLSSDKKVTDFPVKERGAVLKARFEAKNGAYLQQYKTELNLLKISLAKHDKDIVIARDKFNSWEDDNDGNNGGEGDGDGDGDNDNDDSKKKKEADDLSDYIKQLRIDLLRDAHEKAIKEVQMWRTKEQLKIKASTDSQEKKNTALSLIDNLYAKKIDDIDTKIAEERKSKLSKLVEFISEKQQEISKIITSEEDKQLIKLRSGYDEKITDAWNFYQQNVITYEEYLRTKNQLENLYDADVEKLKEEQKIKKAQDLLDFRKQNQLLANEELMNLELSAIERSEMFKSLKVEEQEKIRFNIRQKYADKNAKELTEQEKAFIGYSEKMGLLLVDIMASGENNFEGSGKRMLLFMLDVLKKQIQIAIASSTAQSLASAESVASWGIAGLAKAALLTGLIEGAYQVAAKAINVPQKRAGKYEVVGEDDGRTYKAPLYQNLVTGIIQKPTLVAEEPEAIIDHKTLYSNRIDHFGMSVMDHFKAIKAIKEEKIVPQRKNGKFDITEQASTNISSTNTNDTTSAQLILLQQIADKLNNAGDIYTLRKEINKIADDEDSINNQFSL